jgi:uncharacterized protein YdaT
MKLIFTEEETKNMIVAHVAKDIGIDTTDKEIKLNISSYNDREYCTIVITDKKLEEVMKAEPIADEAVNLDDLSFLDEQKPAEVAE